MEGGTLEFTHSSKGAPHTGMPSEDALGKDHFHSATSFFSIISTILAINAKEGAFDEWQSSLSAS